MTFKGLEILGLQVARHLVVFVLESVEKKGTYELKYAALYFLKLKMSDLIEKPALPVKIVSGVFVQIFEETSFLSTAVDGSPTLFQKGFQMIFGEEVQYELHSIVIRSKENRLNPGDTIYGINGAVSSLMDDNLHQKAASEFRQVIYKQLLFIISEKLNQLEWERTVLRKAAN